jgi:DNA invertase Pin-like site-specific DNA recombinase
MQNPTPGAPLWVAYYRVSTDQQGRSGLGLEAQKAAVAAFVAKHGGEVVGEFQEVESGRKPKAKRPQLAQALEACRRRRATLLIAKLDRLARSVAIISGLMESRVDFRACDMPDASRFMVHIMAALAEHEAMMVSERTRAALAAAKARGVRLGTPLPAKASKAATAAATAVADRFNEGVHPTIEDLRAQGLNLSQVARELNERGIRTARDRYWTAQGVKNVLLWATRTD